MAHHASAEKRNRQQEKKRMRNRLVAVTMRSCIKSLRTAVTDGDRPAAQGLLKTAVSHVDKAASKGVMHRRTASRTVARLVRAVAKMAE